MKRMHLPAAAELIIDRLNSHGYRADIVGGAVRDLYLGVTPPDYDITTNAVPEEVKEIFKDKRTIDTGIKHGTVTIHIDGENYEVTTYRIDGEYKDARHPENVEFTDELFLDLSRRDFTINAMCYNHTDGITDLFGGASDIDNRIVRTVGDADLRFSEDALRILRALRFASVLDFEIEAATRVAIFEKAHLLSMISPERIYTELKKLLSGKGAYRIIKEYKEIFESLLGISLEMLPCECEFSRASENARLVSLYLVGSDKPRDSFDSTMLTLHTDNKIRVLGCSALSVVEEFSLNKVENALLAMRKYGKDAVALALDAGLLAGKYGECERKCENSAILSGLPFKISELEIGGRELMAQGLRGEKIGEVLDELLLAVIEGRVRNEREQLLSMVASLDK